MNRCINNKMIRNSLILCLKRIRLDNNIIILRCLSNNVNNNQNDSNIIVDNRRYSNRFIINKRNIYKNDDMNIIDNDMNIKKKYERGQQIQVKIIEFIKDIGALVSLVDNNNNNNNNNNNYNNNTKGLISKIEMDYYKQINHIDLNIDNVLIGYVHRLREDGKIDIGLRLPPKERSKELEKILLKMLKNTNTGSIPIGDKSDAESIGKLLPGMSKVDFKKIIGSLYKQRKVEPGPYEVKLVLENQHQQKIINKNNNNDKNNNNKKNDDNDNENDTEHRNHNSNDNNNVIFLGNLPSQLSEEEGLKLLKEILKDIKISNFILGISKTDYLPTCHGHLVLSNPLELDNAMKILKNESILGRKMRVEEGKVLPKKYKKIKVKDDVSSTVSVFHRSLTEEMVINEIEKIFSDNIENVINTNTLRLDNSKRFLHLDFLNKKLADAFIYEMNGKYYNGAKFKASQTVKISSSLRKHSKHDKSDII